MKQHRLPIAAAAALAFACGEDSSQIDTGGSTDPLFVVSSPVYTADTQIPAIYLVDDLGVEGQVDPGASFQLGMSYVYALTEPGTFVALEGVEGDAIATRYRLDDSNTPVEDGRWSAANLGATWLQGFVSISPTKAYTFTGAPRAAIEFDPQSMSITEIVELEELDRPEWPDGWISTFYGYEERGGRIFFVSVQRDENEGKKSPETEVVVFDTSDNTYEVISDDRCAATEVHRYGDDLWFASSGFDASYHFMGTSNAGLQPDFPPPCVLRIRAGDTTFDPDWQKDFSTWLGGSLGGGLVIVDDHTAYAKVLDPSFVPSEAVRYWEVTYADAWTWWKFDPSSDDAGAPLNQDPPGFGAIEAFRAEGKTWGLTYVGDRDESILYRFTEAGLDTGASFKGYVFNGARLLDDE